MKYGSVCSGIEAATVAWHPLGWTPAFFSEIEAFPRAVLAHHYPATPLHGDFTTIGSDDYAAIDVLVGGTPCQSFSVAGLRAGLDDERGNLALEFCLLARRLGPRWVVWENVPGVLSMDGGRAFASILGGLAECGYGLAYRVLDAQYVRVDGFGRAVPQRRRRVFVVGYLGDWRRAAAVLFERQGLSWDSPPRRQAGQRPAPTLSARTKGGGGLGTDFDLDGGLTVSVAPTLRAGGNVTGGDRPYGTDVDTCDSLVAYTLNAKGGLGRIDSESETFIPIAFSCKDHGADAANGVSPTLRAMNHGESHANAGGQLAVAWDMRGREGGSQFEGPHETANIRAATGGSSRSYVETSWRVRRLTPLECERLQGFPDGYTDAPYRRRNYTPDGPRYKALGNSMAVNVMRWIGTRIQMVEDQE